MLFGPLSVMSDFAEFSRLHERREGLNLVCVAILELSRTPVFGKSHIYRVYRRLAGWAGNVPGDARLS